MTKPLFQCGTKSKAAFTRHVAGELPKQIGYYHDTQLALPGLSRTATRDVIRAAFALAQLYVPIKFYRTVRSSVAMVVLKLGQPEDFDGPAGTLAMADVRSLYDPAQREIWYDPDDTWRMNRADDAAIYALPVTCHEIGHVLGFGHGKKGLMAPYYDAQICTPTKAEMKRFYREYPELRNA
jgi:hypothetical protein